MGAQTLTARTVCKDEGNSKPAPAQLQAREGKRNAQREGLHSRGGPGGDQPTALERQYQPKGTDLSGYSQKQLDAIADQINHRPRKGLDVRSPLAVYRDLLLNSPQHSTLVH